jgi:Cu-Zn family superoxide dismutase
MPEEAVAVFSSEEVKGTTLFHQLKGAVKVTASFSKLPPGLHGFHIHRAGDLRGEGCKGACDHFSLTPSSHGGPPGSSERERHTGDLGNIRQGRRYTFLLHRVSLADLYGRSVIVHADPDDLGKGGHEDSLTTGHSGARIGCAIIGRVAPCSKSPKRKTRKNSK